MKDYERWISPSFRPIAFAKVECGKAADVAKGAMHEEKR